MHGRNITDIVLCSQQNGTLDASALVVTHDSLPTKTVYEGIKAREIIGAILAELFLR